MKINRPNRKVALIIAGVGTAGLLTALAPIQAVRATVGAITALPRFMLTWPLRATLYPLKVALKTAYAVVQVNHLCDRFQIDE
ncbi:hypothetical protein KKF05_05250 [Patescibacteria group bacterium]|nr:hypothetical protein [Patescibacteria group bacterium]MBU1029134.1 hypothetical protein [Patescibacteria group bacterium]MBU1915951.1 hypothetical protein [Patescibacteria group bacterium]